MAYKARFVQEGDSIDYTPETAVAAGDVLVLGENLIAIAKVEIAAGKPGALSVEGGFDVAKDNSDVDFGDPLYWDADGDPVGGTAGTGAFTTDSTKGPFAGWSLALAGPTTQTVWLLLASRDSAVAVSRAALVQDDLKPYPVRLSDLKIWDALHTNVPGTPANDDLGLVTGTLATDAPTVQTGDSKAASTTRYAGFEVVIPPEYVAGESAEVVINAGMKTTVADTSADLDLEVYREAAPTVDICGTAQQSINSLTAANKTFNLTSTNLVPGDVLLCRVKLAIVDTATVTAVIGKINSIIPKLDIKG